MHKSRVIKVGTNGPGRRVYQQSLRGSCSAPALFARQTSGESPLPLGSNTREAPLINLLKIPRLQQELQRKRESRHGGKVMAMQSWHYLCRVVSFYSLFPNIADRSGLDSDPDTEPSLLGELGLKAVSDSRLKNTLFWSVIMNDHRHRRAAKAGISRPNSQV